MLASRAVTSKRVRRSPERVRAEILEAAESALRDVELNALTVELLMERTGMTRSTFYHYFRSLDEMKQDGLEAMAANEEAFAAYNAEIREGLKTTIWVTGGCNSWYLDKSGLPNLYPFAPSRFQKEM